MKTKILLLFCIFSLSVFAGENYLDFARKLAQDEMQHFPELWQCGAKKWQKYGEEFQAVEGKWIGAQVGFYCTREDKKINDSGYMDVDWFEIKLVVCNRLSQ